VQAERSRERAPQASAGTLAMLECPQPPLPLQLRNRGHEPRAATTSVQVAGVGNRRRGDMPPALMPPRKALKGTSVLAKPGQMTARARVAQPQVEFVCSKCNQMRGSEGPALETLCAHRVCGQCWAIARVKGGPRASCRCPICSASLKQGVA
jgi:hypothetical protein